MNAGLLSNNECRREIGRLFFLLILSSCFCVFTADAWGQITFVKTIGTAAANSSGTSTTITIPLAGVAAGNRVIVSLAMDPASGSVSCSDTAGHVYEVDANIANGSGASGVRIVILSTHLMSPLSGGNIITCIHPNLAARTVSANEFSGIAATMHRDQTSTATGSGTAANSGSTAATDEPAEMLFGVIGVEGKSSESFTAGPGYSVIGRAGTNQGNPASNITVNPEFRLVSAIGSYSATGTLGTSTRWAAAIVTYRAATTENVPSKLAIISVNDGNNPTAGLGFSVAVQSQDTSGNPVNVSAATIIDLALNSGTGTLGGTLTGTISAKSNTVTISGVTYTKAESGVVLTANITGGGALAQGDSAGFTVDSGAASNLVFTTHPGNAVAGSIIPGPPTVKVQDSFGNTATASNATVTINIAANPGGGILGGTATKNAVGGVVSFTDLTIYQAGSGYALGASSTGLTGATSNAFDILQPAAEITFVKTIGTVTSKTTAGSTSIAVPSAGVSAGHSIIVVVAIDPAAGVVSCNDTLGNSYLVDQDTTNGAGTAGVRIITLSAHNVAALTSGDNIICVHPAVAARALSANEFNGLAASASRDQTVGASGSGAVPSSGFTEPTNHASELLFGVVGVEGPSNDKFTPGTGYTTVGRTGTNGGNAVANITVNPEYQITNLTGSFAANGTLSTSRQWAATLVTYRAATVEATPSKLAIVSVNNGNNLTAGAGFPVVVQAQDTSGNPANVSAATTINLTLKAGTGDLGGTLAGIIAAGANQVAISGVTYTKAESGVVLTATRTSGDALTEGDSAGFEVDPGAAAALGFTIQPQNADVGSVISGPPTAAVHDGFGNTVVSSNASVTVAVGSNPGAGNLEGNATQNASAGIASFPDLTINQPGDGYTLTASSAGLTGATSNVFNITSPSGHTGTISGFVVRASDGAPIGGALVEALQSGVVERSAMSASTGTFSITGLLPGTYDFRASAGGFASQSEIGITVGAGSSTTVNFSLNQAPAGAGIVYIYDRLSRLRAVVDPNFDTGIYNYDAVGNLLSIARQSSSVVSLIEVSTTSGTAGTTLTIFGTGFSEICDDNTVSFNGTEAAIVSCTANQIVVTVPQGATSGLINITAQGGSASSEENFTISSQAPTITALSPNIGSPGSSFTITGANFTTNAASNIVTFNNDNNRRSFGASSTTTALTTYVATGATSGRVSVTTPFGSVTSSNDLFVAPSPYTAADVEFAERIEIGGPSVTATISTANRIGLMVFDGTAGQRLGLGASNSTFPCCSNKATIFKPDGTTLITSNALGNGMNLDVTLPVSGTYTILLDPSGTNTGSITLTLSEEINLGPILIDGPTVTVSISRVGQRAWLSFDGTEGQRLGLGVSGTTFPCCHNQATIFRPDGTTLITANNNLGNGTNLNVTLPVTGTYAILIDPNGTNTGSITLTLSEEINLGPILIDGPTVTVSISRVGQRAWLSFDGTEGQKLGLGASGTTFPCCQNQATIFRPDSTTLITANNNLGNGTNMNVTLPVTGTYAVLIDPNGTNTGSITFTLSEEIDAGPIDIDGATVTVNINRIGQRARLSFDGTEGQRLGLGVNSSTLPCCNNWLGILRPDGTTLVSHGAFATGTNLDTTLPVTGTYTILVDPNATNTGSVTLTLSEEIDAGPIAINGASITVSISRVGQRARLSFDGTAREIVKLSITGVTIPSSTVSIAGATIPLLEGLNYDVVMEYYEATGSALAQLRWSSPSTTKQIIPQSQLTPSGGAPGTGLTGDYFNNTTLDGSPVLTRTDPTVNFNWGSGSPDPAVPSNNFSVRWTGQMLVPLSGPYTFYTTTDDGVRLWVDGQLLIDRWVNQGATEWSSNATRASTGVGTGGAAINSLTLPITGVYTILVDPSVTNTGDMTLTLTHP